MTRVAFVKNQDRASGVNQALDLLELPSIPGQNVFLKPNFNSADPPPGSTHNDTLVALVRRLQSMGAGSITVGDRSGMGNTCEVMDRKGIYALAEELDIGVIDFEELGASEWQKIDLPGSHWRQGFALPSPVLRADAVVQACCLKTHRYGGHFTLSLKNSTGLAAKYLPGDSYNYMGELHGSPHQRLMIAELNAAYVTSLVVMDAMEAFVEGGPANGKRVEPGIVLAATDRVAIDAVGVAMLRYYGTTPEVSQGPIFEQEQIARAVELGVGISGPQEIEWVTAGQGSQEFANQIRDIMMRG